MKKPLLNGYLIAHMKDEAKVVAGKCKGKSEWKKKKILTEYEDKKFAQKLWFRGQMILGILILAYVSIVVLLPQNQLDALNNWAGERIANIGLKYGEVYKTNNVAKPLLKGFAEVPEAHAAEEPTPTLSPTPQPLAGRDYYVQALHEEGDKAGVSRKLIDRLITIVDKCENSKWDPQGRNQNNDEHKTYDLGAYQVNSFWHSQRVAEIYGFGFDRVMTDPDLSTHYVVNYILKPQGNTSAWVCDRILVKDGVLPVWK